MRLASCFTCAIALALIADGRAAAQNDDPPARLEPIIVTAQRVEDDLVNVPLTVNVISPDTLRTLSASGADIRFLSARVPSVIAESSFGRAFPRFYIRGIGNADFDLNSTQPVSMVYDGVPYESPILKGFPVFDVDRVEVLKGPQGTLFGRNTPGGVIQFESVKPGAVREGYGRVSFGTFETVDAEGALTLPLFPDELSLRVSGLYQSRADYVDNGFTGETDVYEGFEERAARAQLLLTPRGSGFSALLNLHARANDGTARLFRANVIAVGEPGLAPGFDRETVFTDGANDLEQDALGTSLTLTQDITEAAKLTYIFGNEHATLHSRNDGDGGFGAVFLGAGRFGPGRIPFASESAGHVDALHQTTHELRLAYDAGGAMRAQAGLFYFDEQLAIRSENFNTLAPGRPRNGLTRRENDTESLGLFASVSADVSDRLTLGGGLRWTEEEKSFRVQRLQSPIGAGALGPISDDLSADDLSWDVNALYRFGDQTSAYARIAKGFRGPSTQGRLIFGNSVSTADAETVLSSEAGVRHQRADQRLRASASVFHYTYHDQQLTIVGGLTNNVALFNADKSEGYGFEAELEALPTDHLQVSAGISYNHTEFLDDTLIAPGCGGGCTVRDAPVFDGAGRRIGFDISGNSFAYAPEWIAQISARYGADLFGGEAYVLTDWAFKGEHRFFLYESAEFYEDGYWEGGLRLGWQSVTGLDVSVFARNITDEERLEGAIDFNNLTGFVNEPRTVGFEATVKF
jgi:iron complex outermembrane recepter protein